MQRVGRVALMVVLCAAIATAQVPDSPGVRSSDRPLGPPVPGGSTTPPGTTPPPTPTTPPGPAAPPGPPGTAPPGTAPPGPPGTAPVNNNRLSVTHARRAWFQGDWFNAEGDVIARYRDLLIKAPSIRAQTKENHLEIPGPANIVKDDGTVLTASGIDVRSNENRVASGPFELTVPGKVVGYGLLQPLYVRGQQSLSLLNTYFSADSVLTTTCPPRDLKYHIVARKIELRPERSITFRSARVFLFGVPIFAIGKLVIPLRKYRRVDNLPEFGRDDVYGFYARYRYYYDLAEDQDGTLMGMVTQKRGFIFGIDHNFGLGEGDWLGKGRADIQYGTTGGDFSMRASLNQSLGKQTKLDLNYDLSHNTGFSAATSQTNLTGVLANTYGLGSSTLNFSNSGSKSGGTSSDYSRLSFNQQLRVNDLFTADLVTDYASRSASGTATDQQLDTRFRFAGQWSLFDWEVLDQRRFNLSPASTSVGLVTEIVPQVTVKTDTRRIHLGLPDLLQLRLDSTFGQYREPVTPLGGGASALDTIMRLNFDLNGSLSQWRLGKRAVITADGRYNQSFYDHPGPAAKYIVGFDPSFQWKILNNHRVDIAYRWQNVAGYSPLQRFDFAQEISDVDMTWNWFVPDPVRPRQGIMALQLNGGYDLLTGHWRDLRLGVRANPIDPLYLELNTSYSLEGFGIGDAGLRTIRGQVIYDHGRWYRHELGWSYDPRTGKFGPISSLARFMPLPRVTVQNALTWDGFTRKISYNDILVNYDMGCVGLSGTYRQQTGEFRLDLNITAFGGIASQFGTGRYGQSFTTSPGLQF